MNTVLLVLLALLSVSMLTVAWRRGPYSLAQAGMLLVCGAPTVLLLSALWGQFAGVRARTELKVGQGASAFPRPQAEPPFELPGFQVRLECFEIDRRAAGLSLAVSGQTAGVAPLVPIRPLALGQKGRLPGGLEFEVERLLPDAIEFDLAPGRMPAPPEDALDPDVLLVMLGVGRPEPLVGILRAIGTEGFRKDEPLGRFAVLFRERLDPGLLASLKPGPARSERLVATFAGQVLEIPAQVGEVLRVAGAVLKVVALYPDFQVRKDGTGNPVMGSRSSEPRDPWLEVALLAPGSAPRRVLLSARQPKYSDDLNAPNLPEGLGLRYLREGEELQRRFVVFSQAERRVALVESGKVVREGAWELNSPFLVAPGLSVTVFGRFEQFYPSARVVAPVPGRAAIRVKLTDPGTGATERVWLRAEGGPRASFGGRVALECLQAEPEPKDLRSTLVVVDPQGRERVRKVATVNDPLVYAGLSFLPDPTRSLDPEACAIQVVDRPGAWLAWVGGGMLLVGLGWMFGFKPWLERRIPRPSGTEAETD